MIDYSPHPVYAEMNRRRIPFGADIEITRRCNLRCRHCYIDHADDAVLPPEILFRVLDELAALGTMELTFTGGEPFLHPSFREAVSYAVGEKRFHLKIFSNLTLLDADTADFLAGLPLSGVETTLLGASPAVHDDLAGSAGAFDATRGAIELLLGRNVPVSAKTVVMRPNREELAAMYRLASRLGIAFRHDDCLFVTSAGGRETLGLQLKDTDLRHLRSSSGRQVSRHPRKCNMGRSVVYIAADGSVSTCGPCPYTAGNVKEKHLGDIWNNAGLFHVVRAIPEEAYLLCRDCPHLPRCQGCLAMGIGLARGRVHPCRIARKYLRAPS